MPDDYVGKTLNIHLTLNENRKIFSQTVPSIADASEFTYTRLQEHHFDFVMSTFLIILGLIILFVAVFINKQNSLFMQLVNTGLFTTLTGIYVLCSSGAIGLFTTDLHYKATMEYISLFALPIPFTFYFLPEVDSEDIHKRLRFPLRMLLGIEIATLITLSVLHLMNICHFNNLIYVGHILMVLVTSFITTIIIKDLISKRRSNWIDKIGFIIAVVIVVEEILRFNLTKYIIGFDSNTYNFGSVISSAVFIVVVFMVLSYIYKFMTMTVNQAKGELLEKLAFQDELTGLSNRRGCENVLNLYHENETPYSLISFDLNGLKSANDSLGHEIGDDMLRSFSTLLKNNFRKDDLVGRMGGDEFLVVLPNVPMDAAQRLMDRLNASIDQFNIRSDEFKLSTAYGIATTDEVPNTKDSHEVYRLADERMYENKVNMKKQK